MILNKEDIIQRKNELYRNITTRKRDILLLLDFATGYKNLPDQSLRLLPYQRNDLRLISVIKQIHQQIREFQKEYNLLNKMHKKSGGNKQ